MATIMGEQAGSRTASPSEIRQTRIIRVQLTSEADSPRQAFLQCGVAWGDAHPEEAGLTAREFDMQPIERPHHKKLYEVTVTYKSPVRGEYAADPVTEPAEIRYGGRSQARAVVRDKDGNAILNSAGMPFAPPYEIEYHPLTIHISRNESSANPATIRAFRDRVNSAAITVAGFSLAARQGLMIGWDASSFEATGFGTRWRHDYTIEVADGSWVVELLDQGMWYRDGSGAVRRIKPEGEPTEEPLQLDGSGGVIADPTPANAVFLPFNVRFEADWSTLSLPT